MRRYLNILLRFSGVVHLAFGVAGTVFPRWFYATVPPWPPLHVGQIQIAGVFDLALAVLFLAAATDLDRYLPSSFQSAWSPSVATLSCGSVTSWPVTTRGTTC